MGDTVCNGRLEYMELAVGTGRAESLWERIRGQTNNVDVSVRIYYRPPGQDDNAFELFFEELTNT